MQQWEYTAVRIEPWERMERPGADAAQSEAVFRYGWFEFDPQGRHENMEYMRLSRERQSATLRKLDDILNEFGQQGWELISVNSAATLYVFKRLKPDNLPG